MIVSDGDLTGKSRNVVMDVLFTVLAVGIAVLMIWPDKLPQLPTR